MNKEQMTDAIFSAKKEKGLTWEAIGKELNLGATWVTSACFGMNSMPRQPAEDLCQLLDLNQEVYEALQDFPHKAWDKSIPQDPVVYRFYEIVGVYGDTIKETIAEKFGDGIMSAIDFSMNIDKQEDPKGDRVVITLNGKFLKYTTW